MSLQLIIAYFDVGKINLKLLLVFTFQKIMAIQITSSAQTLMRISYCSLGYTRSNKLMSSIDIISKGMNIVGFIISLGYLLNHDSVINW